MSSGEPKLYMCLKCDTEHVEIYNKRELKYCPKCGYESAQLSGKYIWVTPEVLNRLRDLRLAGLNL